MSRYVIAALACLAGCSGRSSPLPAQANAVTAATIVNRMDWEPPPAPIPLSTADARSVYAALKASEPHQEDENAEIPWAAGFALVFQTGVGEVPVNLEAGLRLWRPNGARANVNYPIPETARSTLSRYVEPVTD